MKGSVAVLAGILVIALARATVLAPAPRTGEWSVAASLARPRAYATALALPTGEILVFGGLDQEDPDVTNSTSELIEPATGRVTTIKDRLVGRLHQTATVAGGRVVAVGGVEWIGGRFASTDLVDVFDPLAGTWTRARPLRQARSDHGAAALPDGSVLVTGGNFNTRPLASSEIYDPATDRWREAAPLSHPRVRFSIAPLPDGRVLVAGGLDQKGRPLASSEVYDPRADRWTAGPEMSVPRVQHAAVTLPTGDVLFIGGQNGASGTAERYDARTGAFVYAGSLVTPRLVEQATPMPDGRVLVTGGSVEQPGRTDWIPFRDAEIWDPRTNLWNAFPSPKMPRALGELVATPYGLYLISGIGDKQAPQRAVERMTFK